MDRNAPKYLEVYHQLKGDILAGKYPAGSFLPVEDRLVELYAASRTTVRRAIALLRDDTLIDVRQGRGTEVLPVSNLPNDFKKFRNASKLAARILVQGEQRLSAVGSVIDMVLAEPKVAKALNVGVGSQVYRLQKLQAVNDQPFAYMVHYLRPDLFPELEKYSGKISNLAQFAKSEYGLSVTTGEETIAAIAAGFVEARMLGIEVGTPMLAFFRTSHCAQGVFEYGETLTRPDLFEVVVTINGENSIMER